MSDSRTPPLIFGIYPGGYTVSDAPTVPNDPDRIREALRRLQPANAPFLVRGYRHFTGQLSPVASGRVEAPEAVEQYLGEGRRLDLALCFRQPDLDGWLAYIRDTIRRDGASLASLQITEEPNMMTFAAVDGCIPRVREALVQGVMAAKAEARRLGLDVQVGFNAVLSFDPADDFWPSIAALGGQPFFDALDYVGLDFFPDVFRPFAPDASADDVRRVVVGALTNFRDVQLAAGGVPATTPIHITEHGWPTGPQRSYDRQALMVETIVRAIHEQRARLNITHYEHHTLRDANSSSPDLFAQFGLMRDDYTPKPAFERYRSLIAELGAPPAGQ